MGKKEENLCGEMQSRGMYASEGLWYGAPYMPVERLSQPVTPRENLLRYYRGEKYYWMPDIVSDQVDITPSCNPVSYTHLYSPTPRGQVIPAIHPCGLS